MKEKQSTTTLNAIAVMAELARQGFDFNYFVLHDEHCTITVNPRDTVPIVFTFDGHKITATGHKTIFTCTNPAQRADFAGYYMLFILKVVEVSGWYVP